MRKLYKPLQGILFILFTALLFVHCRKKALDEYYGRPAGLAQPIYAQLQARGNFKNLLSLIDKAGYKQTLGDAGYWTFFAPTDSAFQNFFSTSGFGSINAIDSTTARSIVQYLLVFNAFQKSDLVQYQSATGYVPNLAFKRRTAYYSGFYKDTSFTNQPYLAVAANRNGINAYVSADNNNKYITYFTDTYFGTHNLSAYDYNYFFPNEPYSGFNIEGAKVLEKDIVAQNGIFNVIDRVIMPQQSIDEYLRNKPQYSEFRKLLEKYMVQFIPNTAASTKYNLITGKTDQVYVKTYFPSLAYAPNNENFLKVEDNDAQKDGWTMFVPTNAALDNYINNVLLQHYPVLDSVPNQVIIDLLNAHLFPTTVWPSKFNATYNSQGEPAKFNPATDVNDPKVLSNGFFYGTNKVQDANVFSTVYGKAYLNPKYSIMTLLLGMDLKGTVTNPNLRFTVFMISDSAIRAAGYNYNFNNASWSYTPPGGATSTGDSYRLNLLRILATGVVLTPNGELNDLSHPGITNSYSGECLVYDSNKVKSVGNVDANTSVHIQGSETASNGIVYYTDGIFNFSALNIGIHIQNLGTPATSQFNSFWKYLSNSSIYTAATGAILGVQPGSFYTVMAPSNAAILQAVNDGYLPGTGTAPTKVPNFAPTDPVGQNQVAAFILNHILVGTVIPDGQQNGGFQTLLQTSAGDNYIVNINNQPGAIKITDFKGRTANVITAQSRNLSNRCVIQLLDNYFQY